MARRTYAPVRVTRAAGGDAFAQQIASFHSELGTLRDEEAMRELADGNPAFFIDHASRRLRQLRRSHPAHARLNGLLVRARVKLEEQQWAEDISAGRKTLEDFQAHLERKVETLPGGSVEAHQYLQAIASVKKGITARNEAKADQTAHLGYINDGDEARLLKHLEAKLLRTLDPKLQSAIADQMSELKNRKLKKEAIGRSKSRADIIADFETGKIGGAEAISRLRAGLPDAQSDSEVGAIASAIDKVASEDRSRAKSAATAGATATKRAQADAIGKNLATYTTLKSKIDAAVKDGKVPDPKLVAAMRDAATQLAAQYRDLATEDTTLDKKEEHFKAAASIEQAVETTEASVETVQLKRAGLTAEQMTDFKTKGLAGLSLDERVEKIASQIELIRSLTRDGSDRMRTEGQKLIDDLSAYAQADLNKEANAPDQKALSEAYADYSKRVQRLGRTPKSPEAFEKEVREAESAEVLKNRLGVAFKPEQFDSAKSAFRVTSPRASILQTRLDRATGVIAPSTPEDVSRAQDGAGSPAADPITAFLPPEYQARLARLRQLNEEAAPATPGVIAETPVAAGPKPSAPRPTTPEEDADPYDAAKRYLDRDTDLDLPGFALPLLPDPDPVISLPRHTDEELEFFRWETRIREESELPEIEVPMPEDVRAAVGSGPASGAAAGLAAAAGLQANATPPRPDGFGGPPEDF